MNSRKPLLKALAGEISERPPFWFMRQAGRFLPEYRKLRAEAGSFLNLCFRPEWAAEVTLQPIRRFGMDGAILFSDILVVPYALGFGLDFKEGEGPVLERYLGGEKLISFDEEVFHKKINPVYETLGILKERLDEKTTLIGFSGAPWTVATYMIEGGSSRDFSKSLYWSKNRRDEFKVLINLLVQSTSKYLKKQIESGAEVIQIFDSWASVLDDEDFYEWCLKPIGKIVENIKNDFPEIPVIGFPKGIGKKSLSFVKETKVNGISLGSDMDISWARENLQPLCTLQGNLDPQILIRGGEEMIKQAEEIISYFSQGPFIFNLGHGVLPQTPIENVEMLCRVIRGKSD